MITMFTLLVVIFATLSLISNDAKNDTLTLKFHCKLTFQDNLNINIANSVMSNESQIYLLPFVDFASQYIYVFQMKSCRHQNTIVYPENAKYCFIPPSDTNTWKNILNSPLSCYSCTFSFRAIVKDIFNGKIYASAYTLKKLNDTSFLPIPILMRIDTTFVEILEIVSDTLWLLPLFEFGKKDSLILCYGKNFLTSTPNQEYFITFYDLSKRKHIYKISQSEIEKELGKSLSKTTPILYFLDDTLGLCYWYSLSPPIVLNLNQKKYAFFKYKGIFQDFENTNFKYQNLDEKIIRKFMFHFYSLNNQILVLGGVNLGEKIQDFVLTKLFIQFYDKENFNLLQEKQINLPNLEEQIKFFSAFMDEKTKEIFFIFYTKEYCYYLYSLKL